MDNNNNIEKIVLQLSSYYDTNSILSKPILELSTSSSIPEPFFKDNSEKLLNEYKFMIDTVGDVKVWDFYKKLSNEYELLHLYFKSKKKNIGVANYDPISRSFFKMWELNKDFNIIDINNPHLIYGALAEGPGGFIECFNYYRKSSNPPDIHYSDIVNCITLKPLNNSVPGLKNPQKVFFQSQYQICYGSDNTGNLCKKDNILDFSSLFNSENSKKADIVTADGGFDFSDNYANQEMTAFQLIFCEVITALHILNKGGHFILKVFDLFQQCSIDLMWILTYYFDNVYITKPFTSRAANSEKYVVCKGFRGIEDSQLNKLLDIVSLIDEMNCNTDTQNKYIVRLLNNTIPDDFSDAIHSYNLQSIEKQIKSILRIIEYIKHGLNFEEIDEIKRIQTKQSVNWCKKYNFPLNYRCRYLNRSNFYHFIPHIYPKSLHSNHKYQI